MLKIKEILFWLTNTKLGWLIISFGWLGLFMGIDDIIQSDWAFWVAMPALIYIVGLTLVMIVYGWIINPIKNYQERKKMREQNKK